MDSSWEHVLCDNVTASQVIIILIFVSWWYLLSESLRMFAGDNAAVADTDIVLAADANMFVMTPEIIRPLLSSPDMVAWILTWQHNNYTGEGPYWLKTFGLGLMAMRAASWMEVTGYKGSIERLVRNFR